MKTIFIALIFSISSLAQAQVMKSLINVPVNADFSGKTQEIHTLQVEYSLDLAPAVQTVSIHAFAIPNTVCAYYSRPPQGPEDVNAVCEKTEVQGYGIMASIEIPLYKLTRTVTDLRNQRMQTTDFGMVTGDVSLSYMADQADAKLPTNMKGLETTPSLGSFGCAVDNLVDLYTESGQKEQIGLCADFASPISLSVTKAGSTLMINFSALASPITVQANWSVARVTQDFQSSGIAQGTISAF